MLFTGKVIYQWKRQLIDFQTVSAHTNAGIGSVVILEMPIFKLHHIPFYCSLNCISGSWEKILFVCLCWGLMSQSTIFQSCWDGATASWVINQYFQGVKCLAQGHNTAEVGFEPRPLAPESDTLPLSHRAPLMRKEKRKQCCCNSNTPQEKLTQQPNSVVCWKNGQLYYVRPSQCNVSLENWIHHWLMILCIKIRF